MNIVENPSRAVFRSRRTDTTMVSASSPPVVILYNGLNLADMSVDEYVSNIRSFMHSSSRIAAARNLRDEEAQSLIDLVDQVSGP